MIITKEKFIRKLSKETRLFQEDVKEINENWERIKSTAGEVLSELPPFPLLSHRKQKRAFRYALRSLSAKSKINSLSKNAKGLTQLLLEYSSRRFRLLSASVEAPGYFSLWHPKRQKSILRNMPVNVLLIAVLVGVLEYRTRTFERLYEYYSYNLDGQSYGIVIKSMPGGGRNLTYDVQYRFSVGDRLYIGHVVNYSAVGALSEHVSRVLTKYPVGKRVIVRYAKVEPEVSALEVNPPDLWLWGMVGATLFLSMIVSLTEWY